MPMTDKWSGLADLRATLIEKYAAELDLDQLSDHRDDKEENCEGFQLEYDQAA